MTRRAPRILFAGGGTGGHVYPAVAIADAVLRQSPDAAIAFAGTRKNMEWDLVPRSGYAIHPISAVGVRRSLSPSNLRVPFTVLRGLMQSLSLVRDFDADLVCGTGGFVSGPVGLAAALRGRPLVIQEQNAFPGQTNRLLGRFATRIYIAFREAEKVFRPDRTRMTGNPVRPGLVTVDRAEARESFGIDADARVVFVFGGSLGSQGVNSAILEHADEIVSDPGTHLIWQTGSRYFERMQAQVPDHPRIHLRKYIDRMDLAYAASDVAVCRAGAITCSELLLTRLPAILVPSPNVTEDHQTHNARSLAAANAAIMIPESELQSTLMGRLREVLADDELRERMREAAEHLARPDAADDIAADILKLVEERA